VLHTQVQAQEYQGDLDCARQKLSNDAIVFLGNERGFLGESKDTAVKGDMSRVYRFVLPRQMS
jgi:hypothetical protein